MFYSSLQAAISNSIYSNINLKVKQVICLEAIYHGRDVVAVLPTGYGKSVIFHLLPSLFLDKINCGRRAAHPVVIVVSPLNALIKDQIRRLKEGNVSAAILNVKKKTNSEDLELDFIDTNLSQLRDAKYEVIFTHPEAFISCKQGLELFQTEKYQRNVHAIVIDEAHCILEWGHDFRKDYSQLAMLCATFPQVPVVALTATASKADVRAIKDSLNMKKPLEVIGDPNRANIFYEKVFRTGNDIDFFEELLKPMASELKEVKLNYPLTILYLPLKWCGFAFKFFEKQLGNDQYYPLEAEALPENRLFAQYHAPQTTAMKDQILKELALPASKVRIIFATVAVGMGVDIPSIRCVIHVGPPRTIQEYFQETGREDERPWERVVFQRILQWMEEYNHEGLTCLWLGATHPLVMIYKLELAEIVLSTSKHMTKSADYEILHPWLGTGLLTSNGEKWKKRRRLITPTFHFRILNDFVQVCEEQSAILVSHLQEKVNKGVFNIMPYIALLTLDIICITSMGPSPNAQEKSSSPYVKAVVRVSELLERRGRSPWLWPDIIFNLSPAGREFNNCLKILHGFTDKVIDEQIAEREARKMSNGEEQGQDSSKECELKNRKRLVFLDTLLEAYENGEISREGVREEVDTFMFEGHDTTAAGITWALYLLGRHPAIQQRVFEEVDAFFEHRPDVLTVEDLKEFRYMECVLKESQRLLPSVPFFSRTTTEDCLLGDYFIPKGSAVTISPLALHRNPEVWPAPLEFDPDRFLPENAHGRHPFAFLPFSAGPRNCIGQRLAFLEEKLVIAHVLRHYKIHCTQSFNELKLRSQLVLRPKEGVYVTLEERH